MSELVQAGKIRSVGVCNFAGEQVARALRAFPKLATLQSPYSMLRRELELDTFPFCVQRGIGILRMAARTGRADWALHSGKPAQKRVARGAGAA